MNRIYYTAPLEFKTILDALKSKKTILVYSKEDQTFRAFGKGEKLDSALYEVKKDQVLKRVHSFIKEFGFYLAEDELAKLQTNIDREIKHLNTKLTGLLKIFYYFISFIPFTTSQEYRKKEKKELEEIITTIQISAFAPLQNKLSLHKSLSTKNVALSPEKSNFNSILPNSPFKSPKVNKTIPIAPPPPPLQQNIHQANVRSARIILFEDEPRPIGIKPTNAHSIEDISNYIEDASKALKPYQKILQKESDLEKLLELKSNDLNLVKKALEDCIKKLNFLEKNHRAEAVTSYSSKLRNTSPAYSSFLHFYPPSACIQIEQTINPNDKKTSVSLTTEKLDNFDDDFEHNSLSESDEKIEVTEEIKTQIQETITNANSHSLLKEVADYHSKEHLEILHTHQKNLSTYFEQLNEEVNQLKSKLTKIKEKNYKVKVICNEQTNELTYSIRQIDNLLKEKIRSLDSWTRHKNMRLKEEAGRGKNIIKINIQKSQEIPRSLLEKYPQLADTIKMPEQFSIRLRNRNRVFESECNPVQVYQDSVYALVEIT